MRIQPGHVRDVAGWYSGGSRCRFHLVAKGRGVGALDEGHFRALRMKPLGQEAPMPEPPPVMKTDAP
jgi:hypothetical protein